MCVWFSFDPLFGGSGQTLGNFHVAVATSSNLDLPAPVNTAEFLSHTIPPRLDPGSTLGVGVTVHNTGNTSWTLETCYSLAVLEDSCSLFLATNPGNRIPLPENLAVPPGERVQFVTSVTAPTTPTLCTARLQMI